MDALLFWMFALVTVVASIFVVGQRNPMYSVLLLIVSFAALSGLYILLNAPFGFIVECRRRLVENQNGGILEQRPCNGNSLPLAAREILPAVGELRLLRSCEWR